MCELILPKPRTLPFSRSRLSALRRGSLLGAGENASQPLHDGLVSFQITRCNQLIAAEAPDCMCRFSPSELQFFQRNVFTDAMTKLQGSYVGTCTNAVSFGTSYSCGISRGHLDWA